MELKDVVMKLIGPVNPIGESNTDDSRFENLKTLCDLTEDLIITISKVTQYKDCPEYSMERAGKFAEKAINNLKQI